MKRILSAVLTLFLTLPALTASAEETDEITAAVPETAFPPRGNFARTINLT